MTQDNCVSLSAKTSHCCFFGIRTATGALDLPSRGAISVLFSVAFFFKKLICMAENKEQKAGSSDGASARLVTGCTKLRSSVTIASIFPHYVANYSSQTSSSHRKVYDQNGGNTGQRSTATKSEQTRGRPAWLEVRTT